MDNIKISLCIPTKDRFDTFLNKYLDIYFDYLQQHIINEIVICDENGNDYDKIILKYGDYIHSHNNFKVYKNDAVLGAFKNKIKVCQMATNNYMALIDSDNLADDNYFLTAKKYIETNQNKFTSSIILAPSFARPNFDYTRFNDIVITKYKLKEYFNKDLFRTVLNTGNFVINKNIINNIKFENGNMLNTNACDVEYFNLLVFQQFNDFEFHIVKGLEYSHVVHNDSLYLTTINNCVEFINTVLLPGYYYLMAQCEIEEKKNMLQNFLIHSNLFYCNNKDTYPPFKNGLYMEEYFLNHYIMNNIKNTKRKYIPALWTNFQIENWFQYKKEEMQHYLDEWVKSNPSEHGYFTIVQYDDGPLLKLPDNTVIYGACSGHIPLPLIYEDKDNKLVSFPKKTFKEKSLLCSFIGNNTSNHVLPNVRGVIMNKYANNPNFVIINSGGWTTTVNQNLQNIFITTTINSKFAFAPRGYGRSSFRFFECFQLGTIPIYVWNDVNWLPFQNIIDYNKLCIVLNVSEIDSLESKLLSINEEQYKNMLTYYDEIKYLFELKGMTEQIIRENI